MLNVRMRFASGYPGLMSALRSTSNTLRGFGVVPQQFGERDDARKALGFFALVKFQASAKCRKMPIAASRPSNTAVTTRSEPRTISPPAKILGLVVWNRD
jgi:hypothetical protein